MRREVYKYTIDSPDCFDDVEQTLQLAIVAAEGMYGEARVRLDVRYALDRVKRGLAIDADTEVGQRLNEIFISYLQREYGASAFTVERVGQLAGTVAVSD